MTRLLVGVVSVLGLLLAGPPAAAAEETQYLAISVAVATPSTLYSAVIADDPTDDGSSYFVVEQDARTGEVGQLVADLGSTPIVAVEAAEGLVLVADSTGTIHVYGRNGGGYRAVATWQVAVPGYSGTVFVGGLTVLPGGTVAATVTVQESDEPYYDPPVFAGVVLVDTHGEVVDQWEVDVRIDKPNAFVLPAGIDSLPSGEIFVGGIPCQAGLCGPQVVDEGWVFELDVRRMSAQRALVLREQWSDPVLQNATSLVALDGEYLVVSSPDDGAVEVTLDGPAVEQVGVVADDPDWGVEGIAAPRGPRSTVYVLEGDVGSDKRVRVLRRTSGDWTLQASYPASWTADEASAALP